MSNDDVERKLAAILSADVKNYSRLMRDDEAATVSDKKRLLATIICAGFGIFGAHRFYTGKKTSGVLQLLTIGGLGIWYIVDFLIILFGEFTDSEGKKIREWV